MVCSWCAAASFAVALLALALPCSASGAFSQDRVPSRILVRPRAPLDEGRFEERLRMGGVAGSHKIGGMRTRVIRVPEERLEQVLESLRRDPAVEYAEPDGLAKVAYLPNDDMVASGQAWHLEKVRVPQAWDFSTGSASTIVAVLDTGVEANHPDLMGKILPGYDFVNNDADPSDDLGHGTAVAGVVVASGNNQVGVAGVAFGALVLPVKVADSSGFAAYSAIAQGIHYAVEHGARIINISIAGSLTSSTLQEAVDFARSNGAIVVAASGNNGSSTPLYPASCTGAFSVGATTSDDTPAYFSNFGPYLQITAPGDGIWTTQRDALRPYGSWRGTSFAAPIVSGVAALAISLNNALTVTETEELLLASATDLGTAGWDANFGAGRIDAGRMVELLTGTALQQEDNPTEPAAEDNVPPAMRIDRGPVSGSRMPDELARYSGAARDDVALSRIEAVVNDAVTVQADGTEHWTLSAPLEPGTNKIVFRAIDAAGNTSSTIRRVVFRVVKATLTVETSGVGRLVPDLNGARLEIGRTYTVRAVASSGYIFSDWGGAPAESNVLTFTMQPGLVLRPRFILNPYAELKGNFAGLVANEEIAQTWSSGYFAITMNSSGKFSGCLMIEGQRSGFSGHFLSDGSARVSIRRPALEPVEVRLLLAVQSGAISGTISCSTWKASVAGERNVFSARVNPAPQAGSRNFVLNGEQDGKSLQAGTGFGRISSGGRAVVKGKLLDGRPFTRSSFLGPNGDYPLFLSFTRGSEVVIGWLNFPAQGANGADGRVLWLSTGTNSFVTALQVTGN